MVFCSYRFSVSGAPDKGLVWARLYPHDSKGAERKALFRPGDGSRPNVLKNAFDTAIHLLINRRPHYAAEKD
jgi:hypothetical protein